MSKLRSAMVLLLLVGCARAPAVHTTAPGLPAARTPPNADAALPVLIVATGATRITTAGAERRPFATPRRGLPLLLSTPELDEAEPEVRVVGGIELSGRVQRDSLGVMVCAAGPVGDHFYAGNGNVLHLRRAPLGPRLQVGGDVLLAAGQKPNGRRTLQRMKFETEIDQARLCRQAPPPRHAGTNEDPKIALVAGENDHEDFGPGAQIIEVEKNVELALLASPDGPPLFVRPADAWGYSLVHLRRERGWDLVATGSGPYLIGWIPAHRQPAPPPSGGLGLVDGHVDGPFSLLIGELARLPLHTLAAGTEVRAAGGGAGIARLTKPGFARVKALGEASAEVVAAVDDDLVVEGVVARANLGPRLSPGPISIQ